jgi:hypothetical protein
MDPFISIMEDKSWEDKWLGNYSFQKQYVPISIQHSNEEE